MSQSTGVARPKPWEQKAAQDTVVSDGGLTDKGNALTAASNEPVLPSRPSGLDSEGLDSTNGSSMLRNGMSGMSGMSGYGSSLYGGGYGMGSMFGGGLGSMYGGGYGMGSMYGGGLGYMYGGGYGSAYGMNGMNGNGGPSGIAESTQATFQLIEGLIGAVAGFAQMLEATYMATHNSFFTMITVAEQFQYMKELLGSFFGIFAIIKFIKKILYKVTGGKMGVVPSKKQISGAHGQGQSSDLSKKLVEEFNAKRGQDGVNKKGKRISWKPLIMFLAAVFGFPYLLNKFIQKLQQQQRKKLTGTMNQRTLDPNNLEFARAIYDFVPENPRIECALKKGELMAIISKQDPMGNNSEWWKVRTKQGNIGYVPYNYLELIKKRKPADPTTPKEQTPTKSRTETPGATSQIQA